MIVDKIAYNSQQAHYYASIEAHYNAMDRSPLDPHDVGYAVTMQRVEDERTRKLDSEIDTPEVYKSDRLLGCWINGKLRFQSRDHEAIHAYARDHMAGPKNFGNSVWVAPVGSFVDDKTARKGASRKIQKVHEAS